MKNVSNTLALAAIALLFVGSVLLNNVLFDRARVDLTENSIYSISDGTKELLTQLDEPINLYFFFSNKNSEGITSIRNYANRVESLLEEYELYSDGKIKLHVVDPEPFSEAEDRADEFGLTAANINAAGDSLYFGLGGSNALDERQIIAFFDPNKESFLEYDISKLVYQLTNPEPIKVTLISGVNMKGGQNPMTGQTSEPWAIIQQLEQLYEVEQLEATASSVPADTSVLMLVHSKGFSDALMYSIDQYALKGGKVVVYADPHSESDPMAAMMMQQQGPNASEFSKLFDAWGVQMDGKVTLDAAKGLEIRMPSGGVGRHLGFIGLIAEDINNEDVVFADLQSINGASFGGLKPTDDATTTFAAMMRSSTYSSQMEGFLYAMQSRNPESMLQNFQPSNEMVDLAARISGPVKSAFEAPPEGADSAEQVKAGEVQVVVIADSDLLSDQFWVSKQNFFGQTILSPFANNGDLATNIIENLGGSSTLISVRGRGQYARPFEVVGELTVKAEAKFREKEQTLQNQLQEAEAQLSQLQGQQGTDGALVLSAEQEKLLEGFVQQKITIRKELREVRHQLDKEIEQLGSWLKFIIIALCPLLLTLGLAFLARRHRRKVLI